MMKRILIVDDERFFLEGLCNALKAEAVDVVTAETGQEALWQIETTDYKLCFLDVFLPDIDGVMVLKQIRAVSPMTKVVMMTAGIITNAMKETIEKDAYFFLPKPFDLLQVKLLAKSALAESA